MLILVAVLWGVAAITALIAITAATSGVEGASLFFAVITGSLVALAFYFQHA